MNNMQDILNAFDNAGKQDRLDESTTLNISVTGDSSSDIKDILRLISDTPDEAESDSEMYVTGSGETGPEVIGYDTEPASDETQFSIPSDSYEKTQEEYSNEPNEEYQDIEDVVNRPSDDLNKSKKSYPRTEPGDNPMNLKQEQLKKELSNSLKEHMSRLSTKKK